MLDCTRNDIVLPLTAASECYFFNSGGSCPNHGNTVNGVRSKRRALVREGLSWNETGKDRERFTEVAVAVAVADSTGRC